VVGLLAHAAPCLAPTCVALLVSPVLKDNSRRRAEVPDDAADPSGTAGAAGGMRDPAGRGSSSGVRKHSEHTLGEYFYRAPMTQCVIPASVPRCGLFSCCAAADRRRTNALSFIRLGEEKARHRT
jgi:hypothetical protein